MYPTWRTCGEISILGNALLVSILAFFFYGSSLAKSPFSTRGEAREALVVANMIQQNNFILPRRNGKAIPSKPPMFHWAAVGLVFGLGSLSEFAIRLPSALAAAVTLGVSYFFFAPLVGHKKTLLTVLILATAVEWCRGASHARVDMVFVMWCSLGIFSLYTTLSSWLDRNKTHWPSLFATSLFLAAATLTKGPAGLAVPWLIGGIFLLVNKGMRISLIPPIILSVFLSLILAGCWYWAAWQQAGDEFLEIQVWRENIARVLGLKSYETGHHSPFYSTVFLLLGGFAPWSLLIAFPLARLKQIGIKLLLKEERLSLFCLIWLIVFVLLFSFTASKRSVYLLPAYPALAFLTATALVEQTGRCAQFKISRIFSTSLLTITAFLGILTSIAIIIIAGGLGNQLLLRLSRMKEITWIELVLNFVRSHPLLVVPFLVASLLFVVSAQACYRLRGTALIYEVSTACAMLTLTVNHVLFPIISDYNSPKHFMTVVKSLVDSSAPLYQYEEEFYPAVFYSGRNVPVVTEPPKSFLEESTLQSFLLLRNKKVEAASAKFSEMNVLAESKENAALGKDKLLLVSFTRQ